MNKHSSVSWTFALGCTTILVGAFIAVFFWLVALGVGSFASNLSIYEKGLRELVEAVKPLLPPDIWNAVQDKVKNFAHTALPDVAAALVSALENMAFQMVFFFVYLVFWIFEPLPISGPVMHVFKSYLFLKT